MVECEDLRDVVLCGASCGGMAATGVADRLGDRIALLVYIDGLVPGNGECGLDLLPGEFGEHVRAGVAEHGPAWRVPMPPPLLDALLSPAALPEGERARLVARLGDQPAASFTEPVRLSGAVERVPRAFIRCTESGAGNVHGADPVEPMAARARAEGWTYRQLAAGHDPHLFDPPGIAAVLVELAALAPGPRPGAGAR